MTDKTLKKPPVPRIRFENTRRTRMPAGRPIGLILCMLAPTGCESPSGPQGLTVTDSAGVRIIELGPDPDGVAERRVLADEPDWVIRSREDDPSFVVSKVVDVELLSQGRIAVADDVGNEILVFDSAGRHVATWGAAGDGPGEFRWLGWLASKPPDSLGVGDFRLFRVTVLDASGRFVRNVETASRMIRSAGTVPGRPIGLLSDGSVVTAVYRSAAPVEGSQRPEVEVTVTPPSGEGAEVVGTWPGDELSPFLEGGLLQVAAPPFGRRLHIAASADGVWLADDDHWEFRQYSAGGRLRTVVRSTVSPTAVSDRVLEERITEKYRHVSPGPELERFKADQRRIAGHATTPGFASMLGTVSGGVAIGEYQAGRAPTRTWVVVDSVGGVTTIDLPGALEVKRWGPDWVIGVVSDELDRDEVRRYRILGAVGEPGG